MAQPVDDIPPHERMPDIEAAPTNTIPLGGPERKPARFSSYRERLDFIHRNMQPTLKGYVVLADDLFKDDDTPILDPPEARFRLFMESEARFARGGNDYKFEPNLDADFTLPSLERAWRLYLRSRSRDTITEREDEEAEDTRATRVGISRLYEDLNLGADAGLRIRVRPEAYTRLQWTQVWEPRYWIIKPGQRLFYETDDGFGTLSSLTFHRWLGRKPKVFLQFNSGAEISQKSEGMEWGQYVRLGKVREALEPMDRWTRMLGDRDIAAGSVIKAGVNGHVDDEAVIDGYQIGFIHREPIYKKWMYLSVNPDLLWQNDNNWTTEFRLRLGVDMLFWGSAER